MQNHPATVAAKTIGLITAALAFAIPIMAQQGPRPPNDVDPARARFEDTSKREMQLRGLGNVPRKPADPKQLQEVMAQVQQDFERILTLHNQIVHQIINDETLAVDFVSDATAEIKKRATRLQTILAFEKLEASDQDRDKLKELHDGQLKDSLVLLCKRIESFITNPVIKTPGTVDAQQLARACRDLELIVQLSGSIKKAADSLSKTRQ
jgi:hypothetical protein